MSKTVISVEHLTKRYDLGVINTGTLSRDLNRWWARVRGKPDPYLKVGQPDYGNRSGDSILALNDISFQVEQGETLGIIGRNGAGKSTLLKILSRVTAPTCGKVKMNGRVGSLLEVGTGFHPELTGRENIYLNGAILGMLRKEVDRKFDEIVDFSGVEQFIDTPVKRYSSGMYVRLAFAVAAHLEPEILIVDEVLAVGDAEFQKKCLGKMGEVASKGRTVLFVSHNMGAVENLCSKCIHLESGIIENIGITSNVIEKYLSMANRKRNVINLSERIDREGNGKVRLVDIQLLDDKEQRINSVNMGQSFYVEIVTSGRLKKAIIGILFGNSFREQIIRGFTREQIKQTINLKGHDVIKCKFNNFPLMHGLYQIHVWIGEYPSECSDYVRNALTLTINPVDIFSTGCIPDKNGGISFVRANWIINGETLK